ncbi:MAG: hypothetical protein GX940_08475 [Clostridiaceae bacterium]|jgi:hypothetical protein|nr:hypothetical protein [Clostridiaceae bacterium]
MEYRNLIELDKPILRSMKSGNTLYVIAGKEFVRVDSETCEILRKAEIFAEDSKTRYFIIDSDAIYCRDFYRLYRIDKETLEIVDRWELGSDLKAYVDGKHEFIINIATMALEQRKDSLPFR